MGRPIVLVFHDEADGQLFERIIMALKTRYELVSLEQLEQLLLQKKDLQHICHISFDDGLRSFYDTNFPLLEKHRVPVSLFVSPLVISSNVNYWFQEAVGYDESIMKKIISQQLNVPVEKLRGIPFKPIFKCLPINTINRLLELYQEQTKCTKKAPLNMNAAQLRAVDASGFVTIGAHTLRHPILKNEDDHNSKHEIAESVKGLEAMLGHPVKYFAYPNGHPYMDFGEREIKYLQEENISLAFSSESDHLSTGANLLSLPRMGFARMGLSPSNRLVALRLNLGKRWIDIKSIGRPSEKKIRERVTVLLSNALTSSSTSNKTANG